MMLTPSAPTRSSALGLVALLCAAAAAADGGRVRVHQDSGPFTVTVFTAPEPLTAGPVEVSVLVQERGSGAVLRDARVEIELRGPAIGPPRIFAASAGTNRLFRVAVVELATAGDWEVAVVVRRAGATGRVSGSVPVGPPVSRLSWIWPFLAVPPIGVALYALRDAIKRGRQARQGIGPRRR